MSYGSPSGPAVDDDSFGMFSEDEAVADSGKFVKVVNDDDEMRENAAALDPLKRNTIAWLSWMHSNVVALSLMQPPMSQHRLFATARGSIVAGLSVLELAKALQPSLAKHPQCWTCTDG